MQNFEQITVSVLCTMGVMKKFYLKRDLLSKDLCDVTNGHVTNLEFLAMLQLF